MVLALASSAVYFITCSGGTVAAAKYQCPMHPTYISDKPGDCPICGMKLVPIEIKAAPTVAPLYTCPMHPEVVSDKPGTCPKCGMDLVPTGQAAAIETPAPEAKAQPGDRKILFYRNPMDPTITSPVPMKDSMGMDYVPVYAETAETEGGGVEGLAAVDLTPEGIRLAGIQTAPAVREPLSRTIRAEGIVMPDETLIRHVHTKISGWIEKLHVNFTGQQVRRGEPVLTIYSPELLATQEEYLSARENAARFARSEIPEVRKGADELVNAARRRLELFDVPEAFINEIEKSGSPRRTVTFPSPVSGFVTAKQTFEGQAVEPGMELFTITDLSTIWVEANLYEYEARLVKVGRDAVLTLPYDPAVKLSGRITYIYPFLAPETRTLKVRLQFPNPSLTLKPGMYANVEIGVDAGESLVVPDSAILDTGRRQIAFVERSAGRFEPREVKVGMRGAGKAQILSGISEGERVVVQANFLLDSESQLRAAIRAMTGAGAPATVQTQSQHDSKDH
jgi:Cu(I)/Ag(I) efflux system membrane fusion protein